ncbi:RNA polymerase sigma factor [Polaribacter sp. Hel_I_88]|uniref:RNA polymerase sigma factor n=1 Tax=Polaribacter sp. Hel_I_88 TaxID=1250006 RepID=UPI00047E450B|nr:sigma-70 family RNA polymerase sigma factor [Polaribacter sp. Hel_I_88]
MTDLDALIKRFQNKNETAFEELHTIYADSVYGIILKIVKNKDVASELTQDVFLKIWNNAANYSSKKGRFFTWILNIARNSAIDYTRSKVSKKSLKNISSEKFANNFMSHTDSDSTTNTIGLNKIVANLEPKLRNILNLLYFEGFTQKEISEEYNIPLGTIKTRKRNGLSQLKAIFI